MNFVETRMSNQLGHFSNTWLEPGTKRELKHEPFQRLSSTAKTVKTVPRSWCRCTALKPGANEKLSSSFAHLRISY
ncbi:MAG: hypothetical protein C5B58_03635 [Acidobacteria bacterium]|nr:MAG: hypothetical protein C5B58_03635 [Acidobacteriota bacterium]